MPNTKDASTSTDPTYSDFFDSNGNKVKISRYQLRFDTSDQPSSVRSVKFPQIESFKKLSVKQCEQILSFLLLGGKRLTSMTNTYHDMEAVTSLLEEKERDLELAAHIGQTLLMKNKTVLEENEILEEKLEKAMEEASQLKHEISRKDRLITMYAENENSPTEQSHERALNAKLAANLENLQKKIKELEEENESLIDRQNDLQDESKNMRNKEEHLITETINQINYLKSEIQGANEQIQIVTEELMKRNQEAMFQQDNIKLLIDEMRYLQDKHAGLSEKHEELQRSLNKAYNSQFRLSQEVQTLEDKYREVLQMLDDPMFPVSGVRSNNDHGLKGVEQHKSIFEEFSELDSSVKLDFSQGNSYHPDIPSCSRIDKNDVHNNKGDYMKTLESTKNINKLKNSHSNVYKQRRPSDIVIEKDNRVNVVKSPSLSSIISGLETPEIGRPGVPGTKDLDVAVKKLNVIKTRISLIATLAKKINLMPKRLVKESQKEKHQGKNNKNNDSNNSLKKNKSFPVIRAVKSMQDSATLCKWKNMASSPRGFSQLTSKTPTSDVIINRSTSMTAKMMSRHMISSNNSSMTSQKRVNDVMELPKSCGNFEVLPGSTTKPTTLDLDEVIKSPTTNKMKMSQSKVTFRIEDDDFVIKSPPRHKCSTPKVPNISPLECSSSQLRNVKSSPHLMGLAAALTTNNNNSLVIRGSPSFKTSSSKSILFQELHGRAEKH